MLTIQDALHVEHVCLERLFQQVERRLPQTRTLAEVRILCQVVAGMLSDHADVEQNLAYAMLDQGLAEQGELGQLYQDHQEIDARFEHAQMTTALAEARRLLAEGVAVSRYHFRWEEDSVFPLFGRVFSPSTLRALAEVAQGTSSCRVEKCCAVTTAR